MNLLSDHKQWVYLGSNTGVKASFSWPSSWWKFHQSHLTITKSWIILLINWKILLIWILCKYWLHFGSLVRVTKLPWINFTNICFYVRRSQKHKKTVKLSFFFAPLGSGRLKAARRTLMKLTRGVRCTDESGTLVCMYY